jgi:hypothetical protein
MFRYIGMPKLVAFYLKEFSYRYNVAEGTAQAAPNYIYWFVFCLCLPFCSQTFRLARLRALAIAECTESADQIARVINKITGAQLTYTTLDDDCFVSYDASGMFDFPFGVGNDSPDVPYSNWVKPVRIQIILNGATRNSVDAYLQLLLPFYNQYIITYVNSNN